MTWVPDLDPGNSLGLKALQGHCTRVDTDVHEFLCAGLVRIAEAAADAGRGIGRSEAIAGRAAYSRVRNLVLCLGRPTKTGSRGQQCPVKSLAGWAGGWVSEIKHSLRGGVVG